MAKIEVKVPDIGDFKDVPIIEILVKPGDTVKAEQPLMTLESDKATLDVPAPGSGRGRRDHRQDRRQGLDGLVAADARTRPAARLRPPLVLRRPAAAAAGAPLRRRRRGRSLRRLRQRAGHGRRRSAGFLRRLRRPRGAPPRARTRPRSDHDLRGTGEKGRITVEDVKTAFARRRFRRRRRRCRRFRRSTSPSSARSRPCRCRASSAFPGRACTPPGSTFPMSPIATKPTSPNSRRSASRSTTRPRPTRRRLIASRCCRC